MPRFSNKYIDVFEKLKSKLSSLDTSPNENILVRYLEMPWFPNGQFSFFLTKNNLEKTFKLTKKTYHNQFSHYNFSMSIFNLDNIFIEIKTKIISENQKIEIDKIIENIIHIPISQNDKNMIILDGIEH